MLPKDLLAGAAVVEEEERFDSRLSLLLLVPLMSKGLVKEEGDKLSRPLESTTFKDSLLLLSPRFSRDCQ